MKGMKWFELLSVILINPLKKVSKNKKLIINIISFLFFLKNGLSIL
jgi:hypothetical protein